MILQIFFVFCLHARNLTSFLCFISWLESSTVPECTMKSSSSPQSKLHIEERTEQVLIPSQSPEVVTSETQGKEMGGDFKIQANVSADAFPSSDNVIFSTPPPPPPTNDDEEKDTIKPTSPPEGFHEKVNADMPSAFEPFSSPSPPTIEKIMPSLFFSARPNHDFDAFASSFDAHFSASVLKPKEKSPSMVVAFDQQIFPDPFFPAAAAFDDVKSPNSSFERQRLDRAKAVLHGSADMLVSDTFIDGSKKAQDVTGNKMQLHHVPPPPRDLQPPESPPPENRHSKLGEPSMPGKQKEETKASSRSKVESAMAPRSQGQLKPVGSDTSKPLQSKSFISTSSLTGNLIPANRLGKLYNNVVPLKNQDDSIVKDSISKGNSKSFNGEGLLKADFRPTNSVRVEGDKKGKIIKFGNATIQNISNNLSNRESEGSEKTSKDKFRVNNFNAKENQPIQVQFKEKGVKAGRHSLGSEVGSLYSTAFPAMVLPTTNSEKIAAAMDLEIRRLDNLLTTSSYSTRRSSSGVQRPISYAEPSTKTKLRRGDKFFPSSDLMTTTD